MTVSPASASTVLFDLDGTLVDSIGVILSSYRHTLARFGIEGVPEPVVRSWIGRALEDSFRDVAGGDASAAAAMAATYREHNIAHHDAAVAAYPGAVALVGRLRAGGRRVGIVTSKGGSLARRGLELTGFGVVDVLVAKEDTRAHKPDPEPLQHALAMLDAGPGEAVYVGDAATDLQAAEAAGMPGIGVTWGAGARADLEARSPVAVVDTVAALAAILRA
ncbi:HAD family hydrolase [Brachybacterium hainanense]|uniref:HAD family hydrolase n=1 Tax=Brachybacterium hainanense TaxID=1541174 RepID=A0ABV6REY7_9MICO